jgi:F-type H+-transporting ATPase subunit delta
MKADTTLAASYGDALFQTSLKAGVAELIATQAAKIEELVEHEPKFIAFMEAPNISRDAKETVFTRAFGPSFHPLLINFTRLLIRRGRLELFFAALEHTQELYRDHIGVKRATVTTAVALTEGDRERLLGVLNRQTGKTLVIKWQVDPAVIGGLQFRCGDTWIDTTLSNSLRLLKAELYGAQVV